MQLRDTCNVLQLLGKSIEAKDGIYLSLERNGILVTKNGRRAWIPASNVLGVEWWGA